MGSIYDNREKPAYWSTRHPFASSYDGRNPYILEWWTPLHDELLSRLIREKRWYWSLYVSEAVLAITPPEAIEVWKAKDPACSERLGAWNQVLEEFAVARAGMLHLTEMLDGPRWKVCPLCNQEFVEDSLPLPLVERLGGVDQIEFCAPCLSDALFPNAGDDTLSRQGVLEFIRDLASVLQSVPTQNFGEKVGDLQGFSKEERLLILRVLKRRPTVERVKELFGSWFEALIEAGVLESGTQRMGRGIRCIAKDGHVCLSLGEKVVDDVLYTFGIPHDKEPRYPEGNFRADFAVGGVFIEYFGLAGNTDYDARRELKERICKEHGIRLIAIYPGDVANSRKLETKLLKELQAASVVSLDDLLRRGIDAVRAGDRLRAYRVLSYVVRAKPRSERAWLWLSGAVENDEERLLCMEKVLEINPNNRVAKYGKELLLQRYKELAR